MYKKLMISLLFLSIFSIEMKAQEQTKKISHIVLKANNLYQFNGTSLKNHYSLGSEVGIYIQENIYVGFSQYNSISPTNLWNEDVATGTKLKSYEYGIVAGYITSLYPAIYLYSGLRSGYGGLHYKENSSDLASKDNIGSAYISPDVKLGYKISRFIGIEAGATYRFHLGNEHLTGIKTSDMNGLGVTIGLVGNIPL